MQRSAWRLIVLGLAANLLNGSCARVGFEPFGIPGDSRPTSDSNPDHATHDGNAHPGDGNVDDHKVIDGIHPDAPGPDMGPSCGPGFPPHRWSKTFGSADGDVSASVNIDAQGNVYLTGRFKGTVDFGGGPLSSDSGSSDIFVASYTKSGAHRWSKRFGGAGDDGGEYLRVDASGNIYLTGSFVGTTDFGNGPVTAHDGGSDAFIASFTSAGVHRWSKTFGEKWSDIGTGLAFDSQRNVYLNGSFHTIDLGGGIITSKGGSDTFLVSFTSAGVYRWSKTFGGPNADYASALVVDAKDNLVATGRFFETLDMDGEILTSKGEGDIYILSCTATGTKRWIKSFGDTLDDGPFDVVVDKSGNVTITGRFQNTLDFGGGPITSHGGSDVFLASFTSAGVHRWSKGFGGIPNEAGRRLAVDSAGNIFLGAHLAGTGDPGGGPITSVGNADILVASYTNMGLSRWQKNFGDSHTQTAYGIAVDPSGCRVTVSGWFGGAVNFGGGDLPSKGSSDIFVVQFAP
ncbi:MAG: hypothetical protein KAI47_06420 [Deltaproteobacteria bacterium]|nr:hypothetical protein [Deltaproteobacteria bacterium]